jgi:tetratricopeptide (TPR) repeat protein
MGKATRYRFLETVRQYASEKLVSANEAAAVRDRHMVFFADQAYQFGNLPIFFLTRDSEEVRWLDREEGNLRLAEEWAINHNPSKALQLAAIFPYWVLNGYSSEIIRYVQQARAQFESGQGVTSGDPIRDQELLSLSWLSEGSALMAQGVFQGAALALNQGLQIARAIHADHLMEISLGQLSILYSLLNQVDKTQEAVQEGIALAHRLDDREFLGMFLNSQAHVTYIQQGYSAAQQLLEQAIQEIGGSKDRYGAAWVRMSQGTLAVQAGKLEDAKRYAAEGYQLFEKNDNRQFVNVSRSTLADIARLEGDFQRAVPLYLETMKEWLVLGNRGAVARCLECLASIPLLQEALSADKDLLLNQSATLFGAAEAIRSTFHAEMTPEEQPEYQAWIAKLREMMGADELAAAWSIGSGMDPDRAAGFARQVNF